MKLSKILATPFILTALLGGQAMAENEQFVIDTDENHAFVQFKANHLGISYVIGRFNVFEGDFNYDSENPSSARVNVTIDTNSVDTNLALRDKHLRGEKYFDVETYPQITFSSTGFEENADGTVKISGDLTLRGKTQSITIDGNHIGHGEDPWGGYRRGLEGSVELNAPEFGFPGWVGDVEIYVVVEGIRT